MLPMSADTLESSASKEWAPVDYGHSRSSTPDSSASSRLAAQLERSAYRRSRSNIRRRQNSNNTSSNPDISDRKASRNTDLKNQQRNQSSPQLQDDFTTINGSIFVVEGPQKTSSRRRYPCDDDQSVLIPANHASMNKPRTTTEHEDCKENWSSGAENESTILTAYPVSAYTVSRVTVAGDDKHSLRYVADSSRKNDKVVALSQRSAHRGDLQNGIYPERRQSGLPTNNHNGRKANDSHFETRGESRVRFEESWEDTKTKKVEYKGENSAIANSSREDKGSNVSKHRPNVDLKSDLELKKRIDINSSVQAVKHRQREEIQKVLVNTAMPVGDEAAANRSIKKDYVAYRKNCNNVKREVYNNKANHITAQIVSEISRVDDAKSLGLRQLIKLHEVQIAEVAKSAALMKRPSNGGKVQEGRLVKVKAFPEIETKQAHVKLHTAKVSIPRKNASFEESTGVAKPSRSMPNEFSDVTLPDQDSAGENNVLSNSDEMLSVTRRVTKPKRHTVEIRSNKQLAHDEKKWKRHTTIGLVGIDQQENREAVEVNGWSPTGKSCKRIFAKDGELMKDQHTRKQQVEPEKQVVDEKVIKCDVVDVKTSRLNEVNNVLMYSDEKNETLESYELEQNDVPPERPPLPENFYSEDILERPPPPTVDATDIPAPVLQGNVELNNEILKPSVMSNAQCEIPLPSTSLPADCVPNGAQNGVDGVVKSRDVEEETDTVLGNSRTTREMYEERLARINLVPFADVSEEFRASHDVVSSQSQESFVWKNNPHLDKNAYFENLKTYTNQLKLLKKEKEQLETKCELQIRDWKRKYEEQQKVANAYQKLEDRYRRRVEVLQVALLQCRCSNAEERTTLFVGQSGKIPESYFFTTQTQSILDETEEWLKEQSLRSDITHNSENIIQSNNARIPNENGHRCSLSDVTSGAERVSNYRDIDLAADIDQYNGTSV